jgi:hypothetical protein
VTAEELLHRSGPTIVAFRRGSQVGLPSAEAEAYASLVPGWFEGGDPFARDLLIDLGELLGVDADQGRGLPTTALVALVKEAVQEGELVVRVHVESFEIHRAEERLEEPERVDTERRPTSWVAIRLVDDRGNPVPYKRYRIETPEGTTREGILDDQGRARVDGIEPGTCKVTFPGLDSRMWKKR